MKLTTITRFYDIKENLVREVGDKFEATEERYGEIFSVSPSLVEIVKEEEKKEEPKKKAKK